MNSFYVDRGILYNDANQTFSTCINCELKCKVYVDVNECLQSYTHYNISGNLFLKESILYYHYDIATTFVVQKDSRKLKLQTGKFAMYKDIGSIIFVMMTCIFIIIRL